MKECHHASQISFVCGAFRRQCQSDLCSRRILLFFDLFFIPKGAGTGMSVSSRKIVPPQQHAAGSSFGKKRPLASSLQNSANAARPNWVRFAKIAGFVRQKGKLLSIFVTRLTALAAPNAKLATDSASPAGCVYTLPSGNSLARRTNIYGL